MLRGYKLDAERHSSIIISWCAQEQGAYNAATGSSTSCFIPLLHGSKNRRVFECSEVKWSYDINNLVLSQDTDVQHHHCSCQGVRARAHQATVHQRQGQRKRSIGWKLKRQRGVTQLTQLTRTHRQPRPQQRLWRAKNNMWLKRRKPPKHRRIYFRCGLVLAICNASYLNWNNLGSDPGNLLLKCISWDQ